MFARLDVRNAWRILVSDSGRFDTFLDGYFFPVSGIGMYHQGVEI